MRAGAFWYANVQSRHDTMAGFAVRSCASPKAFAEMDDFHFPRPAVLDWPSPLKEAPVAKEAAKEKNKPSTEMEGSLKCPAITYFHAGRHYHRLQELNGSVRNGNVCFLLHMVTGLILSTGPIAKLASVGFLR